MFLIKFWDFKDIISGVHQGSIGDPIPFNASINDLFFCIKQASIYNFADDNTIIICKDFVELIILTKRVIKQVTGFLKITCLQILINLNPLSHRKTKCSIS